MTTSQADSIFHALSSRSRRDMLRRTAAARCSVTQLAEHFDMSLAAVSKHVHVLADAGLLSLTREGRVSWCRLNPSTLRVARASLDELESYWSKRLDALEQALLEAHSSEAPTPARNRRKR